MLYTNDEKMHTKEKYMHQIQCFIFFKENTDKDQIFLFVCLRKEGRWSSSAVDIRMGETAQWMYLELEKGLGHNYKEYLHLRYRQKKEVKGVKRKLIESVITEVKKGELFNKGSEQNIEIFFYLFHLGCDQKARE